MEFEKTKRMIIAKAPKSENNRSKKLKESNCGGASSSAAVEEAAPTEDEVDEFFAILRRMKEAVKYFDEKGKGGKEWREALEQAEDAVDGGVDGDDEEAAAVKDGEDFVKMDLDLNAAAPEAAESGGA